MTHPLDLPTPELVALHQSGEQQISDTITASLDAIAATNAETNAVIWQDEEFVANEIERIEELRKHSEKLPLLGVPILVKEMEGSISGTLNSWGNKTLKDQGYCDTFTSTSTQLLQDAGAIIVGKTNNPELSISVITDSSAHGRCNNPLDTTRTTLGSSGGSAAAIATSMTRIATGADGGGSIRMPAAACGVFGFKPSRGRISLGPIISEAWAGLATKGIIGASVTDIASAYDVIARTTPGDYYGARVDHKYARDVLDTHIKPLRIGIRTQGFASMYEVDPRIISATEKVATFLQELGHEVSTDSPDALNDASIIDPFLTIIGANTVHDCEDMAYRSTGSFDVANCDDIVQYFYNEGKDISSSQYIDALYASQIFSFAFHSWFDNFDILITPTTAMVAPKHGWVEQDPKTRPFMFSGFTFPMNISGSPAISIPVNCDDESGLPAGIQIAAARNQDQMVLRLAHDLESRYPDIFVTQSSIITS